MTEGTADLLTIADKYFAAFSRHDLLELGELLAADVSLVDWEINKKGKQEVLAANAEIFARFPSVTVDCHVKSASGPFVFCAITVNLAQDTKISVVDVLKFDDANCISQIRAYLGGS